MSAISIVKKYGAHMSPSQIHFKLLNHFDLSELESQQILDRYFILHWKGKHFSDQIQNGTIDKDDIKYLIIYQRTNALECRNADQLILSFRKAIPEYNLPAYVIVKKER